MGTAVVADLRSGLSPRSTQLDLDHAARLAQVWDQLPPIVVHADSMRIVDGEHRRAAAKRLGMVDADVDVEWFEGTEAEARDEAVRRNTAHGLPLVDRDRKAQARRMLADHPDWSDARIAETCGLSDKSVTALRPTSEAPRLDSGSREGRDGRVRPVDPTAGRERAAEVIGQRPAAPLREVAREAGVSPETVRDVRQRVERGEDPIPPRLRPVPEPTPPSLAAVPDQPADEWVRVDEALTFVPKWRSDAQYQTSNVARDVGAWMHRRTAPHPTTGPGADYEAWLEGVDLDAIPAQDREVASWELRRIASYLTKAADHLSRPALRSAP